MTLSEYTLLKKQVRIGVASSERHRHLLISLKELFRNIINSSRRFEQIVSIGQLLNVLEIRDHLSEDDVEPLKVIVGRLHDCAVLKRRIEEYQGSHVPREYVNYYASVNEETLRINNNRQSVESVINTNPVGAIISEVEIQRINDTLAENIGDKWMDLGRNLDFKEGDIDKIERYNESPVRKLVAVYYEREKNPRKWFLNICEALIKSRRKDLSRSLQRIFIE